MDWLSGVKKTLTSSSLGASGKYVLAVLIVAVTLPLAWPSTSWADSWHGPWPLGETGVEVLQSSPAEGSPRIPERKIRSGLLPLFDFTRDSARLRTGLTGIVLRDRATGKELTWQEARPLINETMVASTWLQEGYPSDAIDYVNTPDGASFALPHVFDMPWSGRSRRWIDDPGQRQNLYRDAFLLSFANDRLQERLHGDDWVGNTVRSADSFFTHVGAGKQTTETVETGWRIHRGVQAITNHHAGQSTDQVARKVHSRVTNRFARSGQALAVLNVGLSAVSSGMGEHERTVLLATAFEDAQNLLLIEDLLKILRDDSVTDPAMIAGLEDARDQMAKFSKARLNRIASTLREATLAGGEAASVALLVVHLGKSSTPAALAFAELFSLHQAVEDFQEARLATLVTMDGYLLARVKSFISHGELGAIRAEEVDVPGLIAFQQQLGYQVIDTLYQSLWEGRFGFSLTDMTKGIIFSAKDRIHGSLKGDIENLREAHFSSVAKNHFLRSHRDELLNQVRQIYTKSDSSPSMPDGKAIIAVLDSSGSMRRTDPDDLRMVALEMLLDSLHEQTTFGLVEFASAPRVIAPFQMLGAHDGPERERLGELLAQLSIGGQTDIRGGMETALEMAKQAEVTPILILMSDGEDNVTQWTGEADFIPEDVKVHSIAFSEEADPEALLRVSASTGGIAEIARTPQDLQRILSHLLGEAAGDQVMLVAEGQLREGEAKGHQVMVESGQGVAEFRVTWPGSDIDLRLTAPDGAVHTSASAVQNGYGVERPTYDLIRMQNPQHGAWNVEVVGVDLAHEGEPYTLRVAGQQADLRTHWDTNMRVPEVGHAYAFELLGGEVQWDHAEVRVWQPDGHQRTDEITLGGVGALLGGDSGQTIYRMVPGREGTHRVQIHVRGTDQQGRSVMRALDRSFRVEPPGRGVHRGTDLDPFIRRGVR